jgi:hypothetical protein
LLSESCKHFIFVIFEFFLSTLHLTLLID